MQKDVVLVSGGFDPVHIGHLRMFEEAAKLGDKLIVIVNNDNFLIQKKGFIFMDAEERIEIIKGFECVDEVFESIDKDNTVIESIRYLSKENDLKVFANGGDRKSKKMVPETDICDELGINMVFDVGGGKVQSSSTLTGTAEIFLTTVDKPWGSYKNLEKKEGYLVKIINLNPNKKLSLQSHEHRSEFWYVLSGEPKIQIEDVVSTLKKDEHIFIPCKTKHRLINDTKEQIRILEIQIGEILQEGDIKRFADEFGRVD